MPTKEITELRKSGQLDAAYKIAKEELDAKPDDIWAKRNMGWVLYSQLDASATNFDSFQSKLSEFKDLNIPESDALIYDNLPLVISAAARAIIKANPENHNELHQLFDSIKTIPFKRDSKWFGVLFQTFHRGLKESSRYIEFADWWNFENFKPEDFQKDKMPNGKEMMAIAEQAYIAYAKHLMPKSTSSGETIFDKEKATAFLPVLSEISEKHPELTYPPYYVAKLHLALGEKDNLLASLLPFVRKKRNDFWAWEILAEPFTEEPEKVFACYCRALSCFSPEEMLVSLREKMAELLIERGHFNEAKTEIELLVKSKNSNEFRIPRRVLNWQTEEWYKKATAQQSNLNFFKKFNVVAESILFHDVPEETVIVEFVNSSKKILNFIGSEEKYGFFKYDRFLSQVNIGDTLKVRFQGGTNEGMFQVYTVIPLEDEVFRKQFMKEFEGKIRIKEGNTYGFVEDIFLHPSLIKKMDYIDGSLVKGTAMKTYNKKNNSWGWKMV
ncbi:MAG: hypothetical protein KKD31_06220 [Bacteroidetes bacterium]|nr:hypothetical protein [Bacteroidota bacterium]